MEVVVRVEESEQGCIEDSGKAGSESATLKQVADPIVYKLVRVDFDGRLVPVTYDELVEVENLFKLEKNEVVSLTDVFETVRQGLDKDDSKTSQYEGSPKIKNEGYEDSVNTHLKDSLYASELNSRLEDISQNIVDNKSGLDYESMKSCSSGSGPNFSLLKGEINLDELTIRELQETFRATFGRKTSVKDKMWLKRRIAMGLTNSCDVALTSFVINDGKLLNNTDDFCNTMVYEGSIAGEVCSAGDDMSADSDSHPNLGNDMVIDVALTSSLADSGCKSDYILEQRAAKRVRKSAKQFIEDLSDKEINDPSTGKSISPSKCNEEEKSSMSSAIKISCSVNTGAFVTRRVSFGGSSVQVPYVSRVRRCRPRQSTMTLSKFDSSDVTLTSKIVERSNASNKPQFDASSRAELMDILPVPFEHPNASENLAEKQSVSSMSDSSQNREPKDVDSGDYDSRDNAGDINSEDNIVTVPTAKGGMKRKYHRAWTLTEVVKLVDGVSRFGPGRWSEIKRLSFSSYSYRTAIDLKDKWRNLLKACLLTEKGMYPRTLPIPTPILVKVRELAEINGQAPQTMGLKCN